MTIDEFRALHGDEAESEGWWIAEAEYQAWAEPWPEAPPGYVKSVSHIGHELQLQKLDMEGVFDSDAKAWEFVWANRGRPGTVHQDALAVLADESPIEFSRILAHVHDWPI